jgi:outer membrane murein-binding lipoprotein Lpp
MYNMDISIFGYKIGLNILILIGIIYLILASHTLCGCCNFYSLIEGMDDGSTMVQDLSGVVQKVQAKVQQAKNNQAQSTAGGSTDATPVTTTTTTEGFTGANINYGESSVYNLNSTPVDTSSWSAQNMTVVPGQPLSAGVKAFMAREPQPVPLPEGEMLMFANTPFKPECCPNTYSNSSGCACMTGNQYNFLQNRGFNNVPYSEY